MTISIAGIVRCAGAMGQTDVRERRWGKLCRAIPRVLAPILAVGVVGVLYLGLSSPMGEFTLGWGSDYRTYMAAASDWLAHGTFYHPYQLAGPYDVVKAEILYPPPMLLVVAPFTVLPTVLWWLIPIGVIVVVVASWRPSAWGWCGILACLLVPKSWDLLVNGNPGVWIVAAVALATRFGVGPLVLLKPSLAPFALVGVRSRAWWVTALIVAVVSLAFVPMWLDYLTALRNARSITPLYSLLDVPLTLIPVIAWRLGEHVRSDRVVLGRVGRRSHVGEASVHA